MLIHLCSRLIPTLPTAESSLPLQNYNYENCLNKDIKIGLKFYYAEVYYYLTYQTDSRFEIHSDQFLLA